MLKGQTFVDTVCEKIVTKRPKLDLVCCTNTKKNKKNVMVIFQIKNIGKSNVQFYRLNPCYCEKITTRLKSKCKINYTEYKSIKIIF